MKITISTLALALLFASAAWATSIDGQYMNAGLTFGTAQGSYYSADYARLFVDNDFSTFAEPAESFYSDAFWTDGSFISQATQMDENGQASQSMYVYTDGVVHMSFLAGTTVGAFSAPLSSMLVLVREGEGDTTSRDVSPVQVWISFGQMTLDSSMARALGVGRHVLRGTLYDPNLTNVEGDYLTAERSAGEGAGIVALQVPEPSSLVLFLLGTIAALRRRRLA